RSDFLRSWKWFGASLLMLVLVVSFADKVHRNVQVVLFVFCAVAFLSSMIVISIRQLKWLRWPCPRCGCAFRGVWWRPLMPKNCVYCGLPKQENVRLVPAKSR